MLCLIYFFIETYDLHSFNFCIPQFAIIFALWRTWHAVRHKTRADNSKLSKHRLGIFLPYFRYLRPTFYLK